MPDRPPNEIESAVIDLELGGLSFCFVFQLNLAHTCLVRFVAEASLVDDSLAGRRAEKQSEKAGAGSSLIPCARLHALRARMGV